MGSVLVCSRSCTNCWNTCHECCYHSVLRYRIMKLGSNYSLACYRWIAFFVDAHGFFCTVMGDRIGTGLKGNQSDTDSYSDVGAVEFMSFVFVVDTASVVLVDTIVILAWGLLLNGALRSSSGGGWRYIVVERSRPLHPRQLWEAWLIYRETDRTAVRITLISIAFTVIHFSTPIAGSILRTAGFLLKTLQNLR